MDNEILTRIEQLYAAVGLTTRKDLHRFPGRCFRTAKGHGFVQDFSGGATQGELDVFFKAVIDNIASFHDHLQKWGKRHGVSREAIHNFFKNSFDFCVVADLWNYNKHGGVPRDQGWSGRGPRPSRARNVLQMRTRPVKGSTVAMTVGAYGQPIHHGDGISEVVITAEVTDSNGNGMGEADRFIRGAVRTCEAALEHFGVLRKAPAV